MKRARSIATRLLTDGQAPSDRILLSLDAPRKRGARWECSYSVEGLGAPFFGTAAGEDSLQALLIAIEGLRLTIEKSRRRIFWLDEKLGLGLPFLPPLSDDPGHLEQRLRRLLRNERAKWNAHTAEITRRNTER